MSIFNYREGIMQGTNGVGIKGIQQLPLATNIKLDTKSSLKEASRGAFLEKFEKIKSENVKEELENIFGKITEQADKIGEKMYLKDILEYKKLVKEFLNVATQNSHQFQNQNFLDRRGRHRNYSIVKTVDRELDSLTKEFISGQIDHIGVLKKIDDIRGLLLDIMM